MDINKIELEDISKVKLEDMPKTINIDNFPVDISKIIKLFSCDCNGNIYECRTQWKRLLIKGYDNDNYCELMLRYDGYDNQLVVAKVQFVNRRKGKMSELYKILREIQVSYKTGKIVIESVSTEEMASWCNKNGFEKKGGSYYQPDVK